MQLRKACCAVVRMLYGIEEEQGNEGKEGVAAVDAEVDLAQKR